MDLHATTYLLSETNPSALPAIRAEVAFVGRSNSGKSSLINAICGRSNLAKVSGTPGRTRTINVFQFERDVWLVDLPGYGYAVGPVASKAGWKDMIEGYLIGRPSLRCIFLVVDAKVGPTTLDLQMFQWLTSKQLPFKILVNKADQVKPSKQVAQRKWIAQVLRTPETDLWWVSAKEGTGVQGLRGNVANLLA